MSGRKAMKILKRLVVAAIVTAFGSATAGDTNELPLKSSRIESKSSKGALPLDTRTILGVTAGKSTLSDAIRKFGETAEFRLDDVEGHPRTLCYRSSTANDATVLVLEAGPMGGFQTITAITVAPASFLSFPVEKCSSTKSVSKESAANAFLRLGGHLRPLSKHIIAKLGKGSAGFTEMPLETTKKSIDRESGKPIKLDVLSGVVAREIDGKIAWFSVYYGEST
jgi:hypothetical protein